MYFTYTLKTNYEIGNAEIFSGLHQRHLNARNSKKDKRKNLTILKNSFRIIFTMGRS